MQSANRALLLFAVMLLAGPAYRAFGPITFQGIDPVRVGMTIQEASAALGSELVKYDGTPGTESCYMAHTKATPELLFMVEDGTITRVETESPEFRTLSGVRVGDTEDLAREIYRGRLKVEEDAYDPDGRYLVVKSNDRRFALVMETDGQHVTQIRAGSLPSAEYIEHCL